MCMAGILDQNGMSVSGAVVREKTLPVKADLKVDSEVKETNIHDSHALKISRAFTGCLCHLSKYPR